MTQYLLFSLIFVFFFNYFYNFLLLHMTLLACRVNLCGAKKKELLKKPYMLDNITH